MTPAFPHPKGGVYVGIERHGLELVRHLRKLGHRVTVITTFWNGGRDGETFEGVPIRRVEDTWHRHGPIGALFDLHYLTWGTNLLRLRDELTDCDVLHALGPLSSAKDLTQAGCPLLTHFHHYEAIVRPVEYLHKPFHHWLEGRAYRHSTLLATPSNHSASEVRRRFRIPDASIRVVPHGVDLNRFSPRPRDSAKPPTILCVGPHDERKGYVYLLQALKHLRDGERDIRVIAVGRGRQTQQLKDLAEALGVADCVTFPGYVTEEKLTSLYQEASLFVHPSLEEGFGLVLTEAMASGVPVVASLAGAIPRVVGNAGILVPPQDPEALADAMERVLCNPDLARELARRGRARVEAFFSWNRVAERTVEVYEETIELAHDGSTRPTGTSRA